MLSFVKKEPVLSIAALAALISAFFVRPGKEYLSYINFSVLILLFCLMIVVAGLMKTKLFDVISASILNATDSGRKIAILLINITFFSAMLITNDVALIATVPLTIGLFTRNSSKFIITTVVMETVSANLGSMVMPFGNPQNLYLYENYHMKIGEFLKETVLFGLIGLVLVNLFSFILIKEEKIINAEKNQIKIEDKKRFILYTALFIVCILTVLRKIDTYVCFGIVAVFCLISDFRLFKKVDYNLLFTFCAFFIFVGNLGNIEIIKNFVSSVVTGHEFASGVIASQVISNVPASLMLSGFTDNVNALLLGVDIGGLGTPVASLASLISMKFYFVSENADKKIYMLMFSVINFLLLGIMSLLYVILK